MLEFFFGFGGRLGRLQYFLGSLGLIFGALVLGTLIAVAAYQGGHLGLSVLAIILFLIPAIPAILWSSLAFQARRFRDIGWEPAFVIPGWLLFSVADSLVARAYPGLALSHQMHTVIGVGVNLGFGLALLFWPSADENDGDYQDVESEPVWQPRAMVPAPSLAMARPSGAPRTQFGRRGL